MKEWRNLYKGLFLKKKLKSSNNQKNIVFGHFILHPPGALFFIQIPSFILLRQDEISINEL